MGTRAEIARRPLSETEQRSSQRVAEEHDRQAVEKQLVRRLARLGYQVELQPVSQAG
jgi:hypothetical protein